jgi:hypothetical protein
LEQAQICRFIATSSTEIVGIEPDPAMLKKARINGAKKAPASDSG